MRKRSRLRYLPLIITLCLLLTVSGTYATWWYSQGRMPDAKTKKVDITLIFPIPAGGLYITEVPAESKNLWGAMGENGKVDSVSKAQEYLLKDYSPFEIDVVNMSQTDALAYFKIDLCLSELLISTPLFGYSFQDQLTITRKNADGTQKEILSGVLYYDNGSTSGQFELSKVSDDTMYSGGYRRYKLYTATIDPSQLDASAFSDFDLNDFIVKEGESATFYLTMQHTQDNEYACFAQIQVLARQYP